MWLGLISAIVSFPIVGYACPLERGRPLVAVLLAPGIPVFVNVGLRAFLEGLRLLCRHRGLCLLPGDPFLLDQVDAGTDLQARGTECEVDSYCSANPPKTT